MMKKITITLWLAIILFTSQAMVCNAQVTYKLNWDKSSMVVFGTSTIHDWEMQVEEANGEVVLEETNILNTFKSGKLSVVATSLKSDHNLMNKKAYGALKTKEHPFIQVKIKSLTLNNSTGKATVEILIAGESKSTTYDFSYPTLDSDTIEINGEINLKMSDYKIEAPVALMGTIKTGDAIRVQYKLFYHLE